MLGYKYLEALPAVAAGDANKLLLLPAGASDAMAAVAGLGAAFAAGRRCAAEESARKPPRPARADAAGVRRAAGEAARRAEPGRRYGLATPLVESGPPAG